MPELRWVRSWRCRPLRRRQSRRLGFGTDVAHGLANLAPRLSRETPYSAPVKGPGAWPRIAPGNRRDASGGRWKHGDDLATLKRWLRYWTLVRHRDGADACCGRPSTWRLAGGSGRSGLHGRTDRFYAGTGHLVDFANEAFELLDLIGWEHAEEVLPALVDQLVTSRGGEEQNAWRHPRDLVPALRAVEDELPQLLETGRQKPWDNVLQLSETLLGDDPLQIIEA